MLIFNAYIENISEEKQKSFKKFAEERLKKEFVIECQVMMSFRKTHD
jgi:hypothetical protein